MIKLSREQMIGLGISVWVSFLSAAIASILFFATFDPSALAQIATFPANITRESGYSIGFLLFWLLLMANSGTVIWLANRKPD